MTAQQLFRLAELAEEAADCVANTNSAWSRRLTDAAWIALALAEREVTAERVVARRVVLPAIKAAVQ